MNLIVYTNKEINLSTTQNQISLSFSSFFFTHFNSSNVVGRCGVCVYACEISRKKNKNEVLIYHIVVIVVVVVVLFCC